MAEFKQNNVRYIPSMCGFQFRPDRESLAKMIYNRYFVDNNNDDDATALEKVHPTFSLIQYHFFFKYHM